MKRKISNDAHKRLLMLVDGSNLAHRAFRKFEKLRSSNGEPTGLVYGFLRTLGSYVTRFRPTYLIVVFDSKMSKESCFRKKILPTYKAHRSKNSITFDWDSWNFQMRLLRKILRQMGIQVVYDFKGLGHECDDYIAKFAVEHRGKSLIISSDKDFCQLLSSNVRIFHPHKDSFIHERTCKLYMGYTPKECVDYLTLIGDDSDDIPGYRGMGPKRVRDFLDKFTSIQAFLDDPGAEFKGLDKVKLYELYKFNRSLIDLKLALKEHPIKKVPMCKIRHYQIDRDKLYSILNRYNLKSFRLYEFLNPFETLREYGNF